MASGASGRAQSSFDFTTDDILCSYEDYGNQSASNGAHSDTNIGTPNSTKDFQKTRMARSLVYSGGAYVQPEDSYAPDVTATVERTMKKYADNIMRFLEGISSRLSQLELYCYNVDKSVGRMLSVLTHDHGEADSKLKSLEKHLQEVHRAVQVIKDKQELVETQKELAKLQLAHKDSSASSHSHSYEERASSPASDLKKTDKTSDMQNQRLALALPHQVAPQQHVPQTSQASAQHSTSQQSYYLQPNQLPNIQATVAATAPTVAPPHPSHLPPFSAGPTAQQPQHTYMPSDAQYRTSQMQELPRLAPQTAQSQVNQVSQGLPFSQYQPQWRQSARQQQMPQQMRPLSTTVYPPCTSTQSTDLSIPELPPNSMAMQVSYAGVPQQFSSRAEIVPYGYAAEVRTVHQQPSPQQVKGNFGVQSRDGYTAPGPHSSSPPMSSYAVYETEGTRAHQLTQPPQFSQGGYPPANVSFQNPQPNMMVRNPSHPQLIRNHPYGD